MKANTEIATNTKKMDFTFLFMNHPPFEQLCSVSNPPAITLEKPTYNYQTAVVLAMAQQGNHFSCF